MSKRLDAEDEALALAIAALKNENSEASRAALDKIYQLLESAEEVGYDCE